MDLQTLFSQMDKIGKEQSAVKDGQTLHKIVHEEVSQRKTEEKMRAVVEAEQTGEGLSGIKDGNENKSRTGGRRHKGGEKESPEAVAGTHSKLKAYSDPAIGKHLDLSG
jgi:hypothetical protein